MVLQQFRFSHSILPEAARALYRTGPASESQDGSLVLEKGMTTDFSTYFNLLDLDRWCLYADIRNFSLMFDMEGSAEFIIERYRTGTRKLLDKTSTLIDHGRTVHISLPFGSGTIALKVKAREKTILRSGAWCADPGDGTSREVRTAVIICTYRREEYLFRNLKLLAVSLPDDWAVYVVDNAERIELEAVTSLHPMFRAFHNPNTGGSGGFTRGLSEALSSGMDFTHVLFMDDDVVIEPEAVTRTCTLLQTVREAYRKHFLAGALLKLEHPAIQQESSACYDGIRLHHIHHNLDLSSAADLHSSLIPAVNRHQYAAWCYCAIPLTEGIAEDLPLPLFLNGDDIEYSFRRAAGIMTLNGIAIWHASEKEPVNPVKSVYLRVRNGLVINIMHNFGLWRSVASVILRYGREIQRGRHYEAALVLRALGDFLKGPSEIACTGNPFTMPTELVRNGAAGNLPTLLRQFIFAYRTLAREYSRVFLCRCVDGTGNGLPKKLPASSRTGTTTANISKGGTAPGKQ